MGLMELPRTEPGHLIITPHPMLLDGQRNVVWESRPGESLYVLLMRNVPELDGQPWAVSIGGVPVERHLWHCVYPKQGQVIEVRGGVGKAAMMIVAMIALTYFTFGFGAATAGMWGAGAAAGAMGGGLAGMVFATGVYMAGSMLINKVLGPKPPKVGSQQQDSVYSLSGARNQMRPYEPVPLLFGRVRITPDLLSKPYTWYEGNDQYLGIHLCAGVNVGRIEPIYNGDTLLSTYEGVSVYHAGYSQMPSVDIPLYSNADVIDGGQLLDTSTDPKHTPGAWVERASSPDTLRLIVGLEYQLYDKTSKGGDKNNTERVEVQYRAHGTTDWQLFGNYTVNSSKTKAYRAGYSKDVPRGQYDVRVRTGGLNTNGSGAQAAFTWTTLTSVQADDADYSGLSRTGIKMKATGQLNGTPDELRAVGCADPIPLWDGTAWATVETGNPGAQILAYARGMSRGGRMQAGMGLADAQIDIESLKAFTLHCAANGYSYNFYIKDARNHEQVLSAIALAGFGQITWAGGRLGVVWAAQEQPLSGVVNMATIKKGQFQVDYNLSNAADGIEYTYLDAATWETKTLRVPAPGVTTMLNPAQVTGEGVTTEQHAARMARWHLAQSLYQYKDISYSTDIEHLSYQRMSRLAMQHDMTQWGYGGRVQAAVSAAGVMTLTLDEAVPAPAMGNAYIGLRIPGERVYRVFQIKPFVGEATTVELVEPWPADAAVPGSTNDNPAHDTIWIYDFKQTPGLSVRVVSIEPESDLKGASVRVVQEGPEFWNYVLTGHYVPPPSGSLLQTRPVASNLRITEQQVVQGNTTFTELTATFDISGPVGNIVVRAAEDGQELEEVAQTQTRTATWRIPAAGAYNIVVRPFSPDGEAGVAVSANYITAGANLPPVLVDLFNVEQRSGGVRLYTWGWLSSTIQSPDFAGVEIRYIAGTVAAPTWDTMTPVGDTGYHTAAFEAVVPASGQWTFACRSRNTAGVLSAGMRVVTLTLSANLGEQIGGIGTDLDALTQQQVAQQVEIDAAQAAALGADLKAAKALAVIGAEYVASSAYVVDDVVYKDGRMYRAKQAVLAGTAPPNVTFWLDIGTVTEAQRGTTTALHQLRVDVDDQGNTFASAITDVRQQAGSTGVNLLWKEYSYFDSDTLPTISQYGVADVAASAFQSVSGFGGRLLRLITNTNVTTASVFFGASSTDYNIPLSSGTYIVSFDAWTPGFSTHSFRVAMATSGGTFLGQVMTAKPTRSRFAAVITLPAGTTAGVLQLMQNLSGSIGLSIYFDRFQIERALLDGTEQSPWTPGNSARETGKNASATVALKVAQDAQITLVTDVNGRFIGSRTINDGVRGGTEFLADYFRVLSPGGAEGLEVQDGYIRAWKGNSQTIMGVKFGASGQGLMKWFGPNIGAAACTKANATSWEDDQGRAYFAGELSAGVPKNTYQSTQVSGTASVETGIFSTLGRSKVVTASLSYLNAFATATNLGTSDTALSGTLIIERSLNGGAWTEVTRTPVNGTRHYNGYEAGIGYSYSFNIGGALNTTDTTTGTPTFNYRARLESPSGWPFSRPEGGPNAMGRQTTTIISVEP